MDIKQVLTERFTEAIRKSLPKNPLIGPKWFKLHPNGKPADFQFTGCTRLAKATTLRPHRVVDKILKAVDLKDIASKIETTDDFKINVTLIKKAEGQGQ